MGCAGSRANADESYARHPPLLEEHVYQLHLPVPPVNGYDSFLTLRWCRDVREEKEELEELQKRAKKKKQDVNQVVAPPKKYYLCLVCKFEPYEDNKTINLQKPLVGKRKDDAQPWKELPKWYDPDFTEDILVNGPFYQNDAFLLEHVPTAVRTPSEYAYADQYVRAYRHHHGHAPSDDELRTHRVRVATTLLRALRVYRENDDRDVRGRDRGRTVRKLEDVLRSMELDASILNDAEAVVQAEADEEEEAKRKQQQEDEAESRRKQKDDAVEADESKEDVDKDEKKHDKTNDKADTKANAKD